MTTDTSKAAEATEQVESTSPPEEGEKPAPEAKAVKTKTFTTEELRTHEQGVVSKAQAPLQKQMDGLKNDITRANERADAAYRFREDPEGFEKYEAEAREKNLQAQVDSQLGGANLKNAILEARIEHGIDAAAFADVSDEMGVARVVIEALKAGASAPATTETTEEDDSKPDVPPLAVTALTAQTASANMSDKQFIEQNAAGNVDLSIPANLERASTIGEKLSSGATLT